MGWRLVQSAPQSIQGLVARCLCVSANVGRQNAEYGQEMRSVHQTKPGCEAGNAMNLSDLARLLGACCLVASSPALAEVRTCTFEKVILRSHHSDNKETCTGIFANSFKVDTTRNILNIQWSDGSSGWFAPHKVKKNNRVTNYYLYHDVYHQLSSLFRWKACRSTRPCTGFQSTSRSLHLQMMALQE